MPPKKTAEINPTGPAAAGTPVAVEVIGPAQGRWRITSAPRKFTDVPTILLMADLSDADLLELHGDPELTVRPLTSLPAEPIETPAT